MKAYRAMSYHFSIVKCSITFFFDVNTRGVGNFISLCDIFLLPEMLPKFISGFNSFCTSRCQKTDKDSRKKKFKYSVHCT